MAGQAVSAGVNVAGIDRFGRAVAADGLLMEWAAAHAGRIPGPPPCSWDAINTPQGLAGYLLFPDTTFLPTHIILHPVGAGPFRCDPRNPAEGIFGIAYEGASCTVEWVIPADSLRPDARGRYAVALALAPSGDSTGPVAVLMTGVAKKSGPSVGAIVSRGIIIQGAIVLVLGLIYFGLVLRANRLRRERKNRRLDTDR